MFQQFFSLIKRTKGGLYVQITHVKLITIKRLDCIVLKERVTNSISAVLFFQIQSKTNSLNVILLD